MGKIIFNDVEYTGGSALPDGGAKGDILAKKSGADGDAEWVAPPASIDAYTKTETDALLDDKADKSDTYTKTEVDALIPDVSDFVTQQALIDGLDLKADKATTYTKTETDGLLNDKADKSDTYTKSEVDSLIPDVTDFVTETEMETVLAEKADKADTYTKTEVDELIPDVSDFATKTELSDGLAEKADASAVYTKIEADSLLDDKADKSSTYTKTEVDALIPDVSDLATKTELSEGLAEKSSLNVSTISTAGGGNEVHAIVSQGDDEVSVNYYKTGTELPDYVNLNVNGDGFRLPTAGYVDNLADNVPFIANYDQTTYADVTAAIDADRAIVVNFSNNKNLICVTYATYTAGQNVTMSGIYKVDSEASLVTITLTPANAWSITHTAMQDKLIPGENIKTVNNQSLLGNGNIDVGGGDTVDTSMSNTSENAVQNKVIKSYVDGKAGFHVAVGQERWVGTYTDENNVTYQVYSKQIYIPALPATAGITKYEHGIDNIKQILDIYGSTTDGFVLNAPRQTVTDNITIYQASKSASNKTFSIEVGKDRSSKKAYVTVIYAKNN